MEYVEGLIAIFRAHIEYTRSKTGLKRASR